MTPKEHYELRRDCRILWECAMANGDKVFVPELSIHRSNRCGRVLPSRAHRLERSKYIKFMYSGMDPALRLTDSGKAHLLASLPLLGKWGEKNATALATAVMMRNQK